MRLRRFGPALKPGRDVSLPPPPTSLAFRSRNSDSVFLAGADSGVMRKILPLLLLVLLAGMPGCADFASSPPTITIRVATAIERRATLSILRRAWDDRPRETNDNHFWYERRLLDRSAYFGRKIKDSETYREACSFWMSAVRDHVERYDDDRYKKR